MNRFALLSAAACVSAFCSIPALAQAPQKHTPQLIAESQIIANFDDSDTNKDQFLSFGEFVRYKFRSSVYETVEDFSKEAKYRREFSELDKNQDAKLSLQEIFPGRKKIDRSDSIGVLIESYPK